jgi:hypothetical protein
MNTLVTTVKAHTRFGERLDFDAAFVYAHSNGWSSLETNPELGVRSGDGCLNYNTYVVELGLSYLLSKKLILHGDYRFLQWDGETGSLCRLQGRRCPLYSEDLHRIYLNIL